MPADLPTPPRIEFRQHDWIPGFAAFAPNKTVTGTAFCVVNLGAFIASVDAGDLSRSELVHVLAESMMHEVIHVIEQWAGVEFSEDRVNSLLEAYRARAADIEVREVDNA